MEETHNFLKSKITEPRQEQQQPFNFSVTQSWAEISLQIQRHILISENQKNQALLVDVNLGLLLESGFQVFQKEKILKRVCVKIKENIAGINDKLLSHYKKWERLVLNFRG